MERVPAGKTVKVHASTNDAGFDATYKVVPAGDITASHDMNYAVNDLYPAEYQPRDRNRPQMRGQVEKMTKGMKPELLAESQFVNEGAPVVNNSGVVLNGNGRVMAVQKAYKGLTDAHKKSAKAYKDYLVSIAPSLGIAPERYRAWTILYWYGRRPTTPIPALSSTAPKAVRSWAAQNRRRLMRID